MKKLIALLLLLCLSVCAAACNAEQAPDATEAPTEAPTAAPTEAPKMTIGKLLGFFDDDVYYKQRYTAEMILPIRDKLTLEGDILKVIHIVDQKTGGDNLTWAYVYEFSEEADAIGYEEDRREYVTYKYADKGYCVRFDKIVVFGNSPEIEKIEE